MSSQSQTTRSNIVMVLHPYKHHPDSPTWVFDDPKHNLVAEPFVGDINGMMDRLLRSKGISTDGRPFAFSMYFSQHPLPNCDLVVEWVSGDIENTGSTGNVYRCPDYDMEGWLCPALFCYFSEAPRRIYIKVEAAKPGKAANP